MPALIFDCDGVLGDTEIEGHLPAFNRTFSEFGVPLHWSAEEYVELVKIGGGKERMRAAVTADVATQLGLDDDEALDEAVASWHRRKSEIYKELVGEGRIPARPGVRRLAQEADGAGWSLAVASTSAEASVRAVLEHAVGEALAGRFAVFAGDVVPAKKPDPAVYELALREIGVSADEAVVVEDSGIGLQAARGAGIPTVVTVSGTSRDDDFAGADLVVGHLGDPEGERAPVVADPHGVASGDVVDLDAVRRLVRSRES